MEIDWWAVIGGAVGGIFFTTLFVGYRTENKVNALWIQALEIAKKRKIITMEQAESIRTIKSSIGA